MPIDKVNLDEKLAQFTEHWSPKIIGRLNDYELKVVRIQGEFVWHQHDDIDEVFIVLDGELTIDLPDGAVVLGPQETAPPAGDVSSIGALGSPGRLVQVHVVGAQPPQRVLQLS